MVQVPAQPLGAAEPYKIDVIEPLTGNSSFVGNGQKQMLEIAVEAINKDGGIDGRPIALAELLSELPLPSDTAARSGPSDVMWYAGATP